MLGELTDAWGVSSLLYVIPFFRHEAINRGSDCGVAVGCILLGLELRVNSLVRTGDK